MEFFSSKATCSCCRPPDPPCTILNLKGSRASNPIYRTKSSHADLYNHCNSRGIGSVGGGDRELKLTNRICWGHGAAADALVDEATDLPCLLRGQRRCSPPPFPAVPPLRSSLPYRATPATTPLPSSLPGAAELCGADGPRCGQLPAETRRAEQGRTAGARSKGGRPAGARSKGGIHSPPYDSDTSCFRSSVHYAG